MSPLFYSSAPRPHNEDIRQDAVEQSGFDEATDHPGLSRSSGRRSPCSGAAWRRSRSSIVDRQWFPGKIGIEARESSRAVSLCAHAILEPDQILCVEDAVADPRFAGNPLVLSEPKIRFYVGAPLIDLEGQPLGDLCVLDDRRQAAPPKAYLDALASLARQAVETAAELRRDPSRHRTRQESHRSRP